MDRDVVSSNGTLFEIAAAMWATEIPLVSQVGAAVLSIEEIAALYNSYKSNAKLASLHRELATRQRANSGPGGKLNRSIEKVWVNVIGFSRGAASARVFVNRLINTWAQNGLIAGAIPYEVNFLGLFDTVASVGFPDSATALSHMDVCDGHWVWTADGALDVPTPVRRCVHFISMNEQRMSFPLDSIRMDNAYLLGEKQRLEVAYPGVHSDVGGGYKQGEQGKSRDGEGSKLSQIALHNMYIEALRAGVPLLVGDKLNQVTNAPRDFAVSSSLICAFNDWLSTVNQKPLDSVETALRIGMAQSLAWRTLRADPADSQTSLTTQPFFHSATEDPLTSYGLETLIASAPSSSSSSRLDELKRQKSSLESELSNRPQLYGPLGMPLWTSSDEMEVDDLLGKIKKTDQEILDTAAGRSGRPGEGEEDITVNDKTDLLEAAEEFRLLLAYLRPEQRSRWRAYWIQATPPTGKKPQDPLDRYLEDRPFGHFLIVDRADLNSHRRQGSKKVWLVDSSFPLQAGSVIDSLTHTYDPIKDFVLAPRDQMLPFLLENTSDQAVRNLSQAAIRLMDDYVHDSRAWFRVPFFHEYAPGGFGWGRTFFVGNDTRVRDLGLNANFQAVVRARENAEDLDLSHYISPQRQQLEAQRKYAESLPLPPTNNINLDGLQSLHF